MQSIKSFSRPTQLLALALQDHHASRLLVALGPEPNLPQLFADSFPLADFLYHNYAIYHRDRQAAASTSANDTNLHFAISLSETTEPYDLAAIYLPKSKELIEFTFSTLSKALPLGAAVMVVGPKNSGIRSCKPLIERYIGPVLSSRSARHCVLIHARKAIESVPFEGRKTYVVQAFGRHLSVVTLPGVFSHGQLDQGTRFFLDSIIQSDASTVLDWACGSGVVGAALSLAHPEIEVDFVDSNIMALESTRQTLAANGLSTNNVWPSDIFSDVSSKYDLIVSNPPFHTGLDTNLSVTQQFLCQASGHLTPSGRLVIVANAFLNYIPTLRRHFRDVQILADNRQYMIIQAQHPGRHRRP